MNLGQTEAAYSGTTTNHLNSTSYQQNKKKLREDQSKVVLKDDKGVAMVAVDKQDYMDKALNLLSNTNIYRDHQQGPHHQVQEPTQQHPQGH